MADDREEIPPATDLAGVSGHEHTWEALTNWVGRYRCSSCGAFGFKKRAVCGLGAPALIIPYTCAFRVKGKSCGAWAVAKDDKGDWRHTREWRCGNHRTSDDSNEN